MSIFQDRDTSVMSPILLAAVLTAISITLLSCGGESAEGDKSASGDAGTIAQACSSASDCNANDDSKGLLCIEKKCSDCTEDWQCEAVSVYGDGFTCSNGKCTQGGSTSDGSDSGDGTDSADSVDGIPDPPKDCEEAVAGCPCAANACKKGLVCDALAQRCRDPFTCSDLACLSQQLCQEGDGVDAKCLAECEEKYSFSDEKGVCVANPNCDDGADGSILSECEKQYRECVAEDKTAKCSDCIKGYLDVEKECVAIKTCDVLGCALLNKECAPATDTADAACGACLTGYKDDNGLCVKYSSCDALGCAAQNKQCQKATDTADAVCTECLDGFKTVEDTCVPYTSCKDLGCDKEHKICVENDGADNTCGNCLPKFLSDEQGGCIAVKTCKELNCKKQFQVCLAATDDADAKCTDCIGGYALKDGQCTKLAVCAELKCELEFRKCEPATATDNAYCSSCLAGYVDEGTCNVAGSCEVLDCGLQNKKCEPATENTGAECIGCLPFFVEKDGKCVAVSTCKTLDCAGQFKSCAPATETADATCGACIDDYELKEDACVAIDYCKDLDCAEKNLECLKPTQDKVAQCGDCKGGYVLEDEKCVPSEFCDDLDCEKQHKECQAATETKKAECTTCLDGYLKNGDKCEPILTCLDLGCVSQNKACIQETAEAHAKCGACVKGYLDDGANGCDSIQSCAQIKCVAKNKNCTEKTETAHAKCTTCLAGFIPEGDLCVPIKDCNTVKCEAQFKNCVPSTDTAHAKCEGCLVGYLAKDGLCLPSVQCSELQCDKKLLKCVASTDVTDAVCEGCDPALAATDKNGKCALLNCQVGAVGSILTQCQEAKKACEEGVDGKPAQCGQCYAGFKKEGDKCVPVKTCSELPCVKFEKKYCVEAGVHSDAQCADCFVGYYLTLNGKCELDSNDCTNGEKGILTKCNAVDRECKNGPGGQPSSPFATCGDCLEGTIENTGTGQCEEISTCEELNCEKQKKTCDIVKGNAKCLECIGGFVANQSTGVCEKALTCLDLTCPDGFACQETTGTENAYCYPGCPGQQVWNGTKCITCPPCVGDGVTGELWPNATLGGKCICVTKPGYFFKIGDDVSAYACDQDGDGWVRESARQSLESTDPAVQKNARCTLRKIDRFVLENWVGETEVVSLLAKYNVASLTLYETDRNDSQALLDQNNPKKYGYLKGRPLLPSELNRMTKYCVAGFDFNDNQFEDVGEFDTDDLPPNFSTKLKLFNTYSYFAELHDAWYTAPLEGEKFGAYHIREKSRIVDDAFETKNYLFNGDFELSGGWTAVGELEQHSQTTNKHYSGKYAHHIKNKKSDGHMGISSLEVNMENGTQVDIRVSFYALQSIDLTVKWDGQYLQKGFFYGADQWHHLQIPHTVTNGGGKLEITNTIKFATWYLDGVAIGNQKKVSFPVRLNTAHKGWQQCVVQPDQNDYTNPVGVDFRRAENNGNTFDFEKPTPGWTVHKPNWTKRPYVPVQGMTYHSQFKCVSIYDSGTQNLDKSYQLALPLTDYGVNACHALAQSTDPVGGATNPRQPVVECSPIGAFSEVQCKEFGKKDNLVTWDKNLSKCKVLGGFTGWAAVSDPTPKKGKEYKQGCTDMCLSTRARCGLCGTGNWNCGTVAACVAKCGAPTTPGYAACSADCKGGTWCGAETWDCSTSPGGTQFGLASTCQDVVLPPALQGKISQVQCAEPGTATTGGGTPTFYFVSNISGITEAKGANGSRAKPFSSIQEAIDYAYKQKKYLTDYKVVFIAQGTYEGRLIMKDGVSIMGGMVDLSKGGKADFVYVPGSRPTLKNSTQFANGNNHLWTIYAANCKRQTVIQDIKIVAGNNCQYVSNNANLIVAGVWAYLSDGLYLRNVDVMAGNSKGQSHGIWSNNSNGLTIHDSKIQTCKPAGTKSPVNCPKVACNNPGGCTAVNQVGDNQYIAPGISPTCKDDKGANSCIVGCEPYPFKSCLEAKLALGNAADGMYWIDRDTSSGPLKEIQVYCDMTTENGGYTYYTYNHGKGVNSDISKSMAHYFDMSNPCTNRAMELVAIKSATQAHKSLRPHLEDLGYDLKSYGGVPISYSYMGNNNYASMDQYKSTDYLGGIFDTLAAENGYDKGYVADVANKKCAGFGYTDNGGISSWKCHHATKGEKWDDYLSKCMTTNCLSEGTGCTADKECKAAWLCARVCNNGKCVENCGAGLKGNDIKLFDAALSCGVSNGCVAQFTYALVCSTNDKESPLHYGKSKEMPGLNCLDIRDKTGNTASGKYWVNNTGQAKAPYQVNCDMRYGKLYGDPGQSCKDILDTLVTAESGTYWLYGAKDKPSTFQAYCDMKTQGGGWTLISTTSKTDSSATIIGTSVCTTLDKTKLCKGIMPLSVNTGKGNSGRQILVHDLDSGAYIIYGDWGRTKDESTNLRYFKNDPLYKVTAADKCKGSTNICWDSSRDPNLKVVAASFNVTPTGVLKQSWNSGGWSVGYGKTPTFDNFRIHASRYGDEHDLRKTSSTGEGAKIQKLESDGVQAIYWR